MLRLGEHIVEGEDGLEAVRLTADLPPNVVVINLVPKPNPLNPHNSAEIVLYAVRKNLILPRAYGAKYPLISMNTSVGSVTKMLMSPFGPAGTIAALATTLPAREFRVETKGLTGPLGHAVKYPNEPEGQTDTLSE